MYNPRFTTVLRTYAELYYRLGFNITVLKDNGKWPCHKWKPFQYRRQTEQEAFHRPWVQATGIGTITGINNLFCLDFDKCDNGLIPYYLSRLKLPEDYNWTVLSGSGEGFHIWFSCNDLLSDCGESKVITFKPQMPDTFKQVELRLNAHVVLPPSKHSSGNHYKFYSNNNLHFKPKHISYGNISNIIGRPNYKP